MINIYVYLRCFSAPGIILVIYMGLVSFLVPYISVLFALRCTDGIGKLVQPPDTYFFFFRKADAWGGERGW